MEAINYSIIIPHYNIPDLLGRCLRSIPDRDDIQVIVVDDQSPGYGNYLSAIPELRKKNVEFYVVDEKKGAGYARNIGLEHAKGNWLVFADSDDFFADDIEHIFEDYIDSDDDVIYFNTQSCMSDDITKTFNRSYDVLFRNYESTGDKRWFTICYPQPWGKIISRQLVVNNNIKFQETLANNDLLFAIKTGTLAKSIKVVDRLMYWYTHRIGSLTATVGLEPLPKHLDRIRAYYSSYLFLKEAGVQTNFPMYWIPVQTCLPFRWKRFRECINFLNECGIPTDGFLWRALKYCLLFPFYRFRILTDKGHYSLISK